MRRERDMNFVHNRHLSPSVIQSDENALLDISDFDSFDDQRHDQLLQLMGRSGKRKHSLSHSSVDQDLNSCAADEDSGFCGSDLPVTANKMVRFDDEVLLLKALMKEVNEPIVTNNQILNNKINSMKAQTTNYPSKSKNGKYELKILSQPEEQHRARYLTEGSRGAIKDKSGLGHPVVKLCGYNKGPIKIQCFIGHDKQMGASHLFYQASKISGKNSTRCSTKKIDGTTVILMDACPENDMQVTVDCVGILKERNVDVEQKLTRFKDRSESEGFVTIPTKKRSTRCRIVFRAQIPETSETLQVVSSPILCTQPLGTPEICKKSVSECSVKGGIELFIIGKNFLKDAKVVWKGQDWTKIVEPDKEFLHPTHLVCSVPAYDGPHLKTHQSIDISLLIKSGGKYSDPHKFTYYNVDRVNALSLLNGTPAQITSASAPDQLLVSNLEKPIIFTMIGSTAIADPIVSQSLTHMSANHLNSICSDTSLFRRDSASENTILSVISEDSQMSSSPIISSSLQREAPLTSFSLSNGLVFDNSSQKMAFSQPISSIGGKAFKTEIPLIVNENTCDSTTTTDSVVTASSAPLVQPLPQYLPLNSFDTIPSNEVVMDSTPQMANIESAPAVNAMNCGPILEAMPSTSIASTPSLSLVNNMTAITSPVESKALVTQQSDSMKALIAQNPVLTSTASATPVTTIANNISTLSEMTDAELLRFINPATFDQSMRRTIAYNN